MVHRSTDGKIFLGFGHKKTGYWKNPLALERETFAQYGRMVYDGNIDVLKMFKDIFPDSETELTETIRRMIK